MDSPPRFFPFGCSGIFSGLIATLVVFGWLGWPESPQPPPASGGRVDFPPGLKKSAPWASGEWKHPIGKNAEIESIDAWMKVSAGRARLMSREAMAGYEPIIVALHLSPRRVLRLKQLIVERAESARDADQLGKEGHLGPQQIRGLRDEAEAASDSELGEIVGSADFPAVQEMLQLGPQLAEIAHSIGRELAPTATPLDAGQMLQLARLYKLAYAENPARRLTDRRADAKANTELADIDRQTLVLASAILKPGQLDVLRKNPAVAVVPGAAPPRY